MIHVQPSCLAETNKTRYDEVSLRVEKAIGELLAQSKRISFYSVAEKAGVARSTLYRRKDLRAAVEEARNAMPSSMPCRTEAHTCIGELKMELEQANRRIAELESVLHYTSYRYAFVAMSVAA